MTNLQNKTLDDLEYSMRCEAYKLHNLSDKIYNAVALDRKYQTIQGFSDNIITKNLINNNEQIKKIVSQCKEYLDSLPVYSGEESPNETVTLPQTTTK